jgi:predicted permease
MNSWALRLFSRVSVLFGQNKAESEFDCEMQIHLQLLREKFLRQGMGPEDADSAARRQFGNTTSLRQRHRESRTFLSFSTIYQDVRYGLRMLRKGPGFTAIAVGSLALAIGANTAIFSIAKSLLYDRLGVAHPEQLRIIGWNGDDHTAVHGFWSAFNAGAQGMKSECFSYPVFLQFQSHDRELKGIFGFKDFDVTAGIRGNEQRASMELVTGSYYAVLGTRPRLGRAIQPSDVGAAGTGAVAVISDGLWEREYGRSAAVLGQTITIDRTALTIVGVNPRGFTGAQSVQTSPDVFVPMSMQPLVNPMPGKDSSLLTVPDMWWMEVMGRARSGVPESEALAALDVELAGAMRATMKVKPDETIPRIVVADGSRGLHQLDEDFKKPVDLLMVLVGLVLLLACANIANLLLARGAHRQREMSVRLALGAGRARVLRQMLIESLLLAALGGAGGVFVGFMGRNVLPRLLADRWEQGRIGVHFDWGVFAFTAAVTLLTGILFGLAPAWSAARAEVSSSMKESAQTATRRRKGMSGKALVGFQIALSTLLVIGAGLFLRTVAGLSQVNAGFRTDHLLIAGIDLPRKRYPEGKDVVANERLEQAIAAAPGVEGVSAMSMVYLTGAMMAESFATEEEEGATDKTKLGNELVNKVGNQFFPAMGIPIVAGRGFVPQDTATSTKVAVINQSLAKARFPHGNPLGKRFTIGGPGTSGWIQVVGVCADTRYASLRDDPSPQFFLPYVQQSEVGGMTYAIRTHVDAASIVPTLRRAVARIDSGLTLTDVHTEQQDIDESLRTERVLATLTAGFGVLALALACVGIYGIMAYSVANRRNEIGIRLALGAQPAQVRGMILRESTWLAAAGIVVGVGAALGLTHFIKSMLYGVAPDDAATVMGGALILLAVAPAASWIPARRAARVQPMEALRHE